VRGYPFLAARIERIPEVEKANGGVEARMMLLKQRAAEALQLLPQTPHELVAAIQSFNAPGALADMVAGFMDIQARGEAGILETVDVEQRLDKVLALLAHRIAVMRLSREIGTRTRRRSTKRQREYILREQLKQIQKELGDDTETAELEELEQLIAKAKMPRGRAAGQQGAASAQADVGRIDGIFHGAHLSRVAHRTALERHVAKDIDLAEARRILDEDHFAWRR